LSYLLPNELYGGSNLNDPFLLYGSSFIIHDHLPCKLCT
jgi:hypothetical protein